MTDFVIDLPDAVIDINCFLRVTQILIFCQIACIIFLLLIEAEIQQLGSQKKFVIYLYSLPLLGLGVILVSLLTVSGAVGCLFHRISLILDLDERFLMATSGDTLDESAYLVIHLFYPL